MPTGAVFLSYASEDAAAAERIAAALQEAGIEVWFDRSELRGGDAWDQKIRRQIKACTLFVAVISRNACARHEGYFRLEWKLATDRSHLMSATRAFLVPVVVDDTPQDDEDVPERMREIHWTALPGGATPREFAAHVAALVAAGGEAAGLPAEGKAPPAAAGPVPGTRRLGRLALYASLAGAVVLATVLVSQRLAVGPGEASIAVLPLANESGDASQQYFSDGISEDLITALSQFPKLKVIGRASAFHFRDSKEGSQAIAAKLGVAHLLEGTVRRDGEMVRVSTELIAGTDGRTEWSERYDRPYKDLFALQDDITRAVVRALRAKLLPGEHAAAQSDRPPGGNLEAYNALLQGRFYYFRHTEADYRKAIEWYRQVTQLDARYAVAWSELSRTWAGLASEFLGGAEAAEAYRHARESADRALALAPDLAAAHRARGYLLQLADRDWRGAEAEFRRAIALEPNDAAGKHDLGALLASRGELGPAIDLTRQALAAEPLRATWYTWLAVYHSGLGHLDEAERQIRKAIELQPGAAGYHQALAVIEIQRGDAKAALAAAEAETPGAWRDSALALATQVGSDRGAADAALRTLIDRDAGDAPYQVAEVYALRGDAGETFRWLDRAWDAGDAGISYVLYDPLLARFRSDPRFAAFCRKAGLPEPKPAAGSH